MSGLFDSRSPAFDTATARCPKCSPLFLPKAPEMRVEQVTRLYTPFVTKLYEPSVTNSTSWCLATTKVPPVLSYS